MIRVEFTISRRHLLVLVGILAVAVLAIPSVSWGANRFEDVPDSNVFASDIEWLADAGITKGCNPSEGNTRFCPDSYVTRGQMAAFIHRLSGGDRRTVDGRLDAIEQLLAGVSRNGDTLLFDGMNLQVANGNGYGSSSANGLGNVVIGYNFKAGAETGSHYLVIGERNAYTGVDGIIAGNNGSASGHNTYIIGGSLNTAEGYDSVVIGGEGNYATGRRPVVIGGSFNKAFGDEAVTLGGSNNTGHGPGSTVTGGRGNVANGDHASVSGGRANYANGAYSSVSGGHQNYATGDYSSVSGGSNNVAMGNYSSILGAQSLQLWLDHETYPSGP